MRNTNSLVNECLSSRSVMSKDRSYSRGASKSVRSSKSNSRQKPRKSQRNANIEADQRHQNNELLLLDTSLMQKSVFSVKSARSRSVQKSFRSERATAPNINLRASSSVRPTTTASSKMQIDRSSGLPFVVNQSQNYALERSAFQD